MNTKLEDENKQLIFQLQALLQQNQELLSQTLESSEHFREEENAYRDQLANLRRAKEKLEEKIMDQYKTYDRPGGKKLVFLSSLSLSIYSAIYLFLSLYTFISLCIETVYKFSLLAVIPACVDSFAKPT